MSDKRQKNQLVLAFTEEGRSEAPKASQEGTESLTAKCETERPASHEPLMEEVCERENCWQAYKRTKEVRGSTVLFFFSSRRRHTRLTCDWSSDVCSSD